MEIIQIKEHMESIVREIGKARREIETKGIEKAKAVSEYDKKVAITLAELRNNESYHLNDKTYNAPPVSVMEKIAKGICSEERYRLEIAESGYKAVISNLEALKSQLNAYQSIYRHLE